MMINEGVRPGSDRSRSAAGPLSEIGVLVERARTGDISEGAALSRIAVLARDATAGEIYQKPWG